jgi:hypothetical protein
MTLANTVVGQSAERGALPLLYAAAPDVEGGEYYGPDRFMNVRGAPEKQEPNAASDEDDAARLWERSEGLTGVSYNLV